MSEYDSCAHILSADFRAIGGDELESEAAKARHTLELAASRVYALLTLIEKGEHYTKLRQEVMTLRKNRS